MAESNATSAPVERVSATKTDEAGQKWSGKAKPPTERKSIVEDREGKSNAGKSK